MSFTLRKLAVLAYAQGFTTWVYRDHTVPLAVMREGNFFYGAADMFHEGDFIFCLGQDGGTILVVQQVTETTVKVEDLK